MIQYPECADGRSWGSWGHPEEAPDSVWKAEKASWRRWCRGRVLKLVEELDKQSGEMRCLGRGSCAYKVQKLRWGRQCSRAEPLAPFRGQSEVLLSTLLRASWLGEGVILTGGSSLLPRAVTSPLNDRGLRTPGVLGTGLVTAAGSEEDVEVTGTRKRGSGLGKDARFSWDDRQEMEWNWEEGRWRRCICEWDGVDPAELRLARAEWGEHGDWAVCVEYSPDGVCTHTSHPSFQMPKRTLGSPKIYIYFLIARWVTPVLNPTGPPGDAFSS